MASRGYKKVITLGLDYSDFQGGVTAVNRQIRVLDSEFRNTSEKAKDFGTNIDKLGLKQEQLSQKVILQSQKVELLKKKYEESAKATGESSKATDDARIKYKDAETQLLKLQKSLDEVNRELNQQSSVFLKASDNIDKFRLKAEQSGIDLEKLGKGMQVIGATLTAAVTVPLVALGTVSTKAFIGFESAFAGVRKTVNATEEQFEALEKGIRSMAKEIPATAIEIAEVAEAAGQLGIKTDAVLEFTKTMTNLGVATDLTAQQAAMSLAQLANITQMPQDQFDRLGSTIVALGNNLATTESKIVDMGLRLAGAGKQVGLTEAQILSFAGALSSVGIEAEAGGSAFSKVMVQMQLAVEKGGDSLKNFAKIAGVSTGEFKRMFKEDATSAIIAFVEGLGNAESKGKSAIAMLDDMGISEVRLRDALLRAAGAGNLFSESLQIGTKAWQENTALTKEAEERYKTFESRLTVFKNKLHDIAILLGGSISLVFSDLLAIINPILDVIGYLVSAFTKLPEPIQKTVVGVGMLAAAFGPAVLIGGKLIESSSKISEQLKNVSVAFDFLKSGILNFNIATISSTVSLGAQKVALVASTIATKAATVAQAAFNLVMTANPIVLVVAAIAALIAILIILYKNVESVRNFFNSLWDTMKTVGQNIWDSTVGIFQRIIEAIQAFIEKIKKFISDFINAITAPFRAISNLFNDKKVNLDYNVNTQINSLPRYAVGTKNHPGGLAIVGEEGPEVVDLPKGSKVYTNEESRNMLSSGGDTFVFNVNMRDIDDLVEYARQQRDKRRFNRMGEVTG